MSYSQNNETQETTNPPQKDLAHGVGRGIFLYVVPDTIPDIFQQTPICWQYFF